MNELLDIVSNPSVKLTFGIVIGICAFMLVVIVIVLYIDHSVNKETEEENKEDHHHIDPNKKNWREY